MGKCDELVARLKSEHHNPYSCGDCDPCIGGRPDQCAISPSHNGEIIAAITELQAERDAARLECNRMHTVYDTSFSCQERDKLQAEVARLTEYGCGRNWLRRRMKFVDDDIVNNNPAAR